MENMQQFRQHIVLGVITLILALILLALTFVPRQVHIQYEPSGSGQISSFVKAR